MNNDILQGINSQYKLYGVVFRIWSFNFEYYITYLNIGLKDRWYEFNDSSVTKIGNEYI